MREELVTALAEGRGVTAKVKWTTKTDDEGRGRWIHCTPLFGSNGSIGVWMVVIVNDEKQIPHSRYRQAPAVAGNVRGSRERGGSGRGDRSETSSLNGDDPYSLPKRTNPVLGLGVAAGPPRSKYAGGYHHVNGGYPPGSASPPGGGSVSSLKI